MYLSACLPACLPHLPVCLSVYAIYHINVSLSFLSVQISTFAKHEIEITWKNVWDMDVSQNRGTPKWMIYNGKPYQNGWFGGKTPPFSETSIFGGYIKLPWRVPTSSPGKKHKKATFAVPASWCPLRPRDAGGLYMIFVAYACAGLTTKNFLLFANCQSKTTRAQYSIFFVCFFWSKWDNNASWKG